MVHRMTAIIFLIAMTRQSLGTNIRDCSPNQPLEVEENTRNYIITCDNLDYNAQVDWQVERTISGRSENFTVGCPTSSINCTPGLQDITFSRPSFDVSSARIAYVSRTMFDVLRITCMISFPLWWFVEQSTYSCDIGITYAAEVSSCNIRPVVSDSKWTLAGLCSIKKVFSTFNRYNCRLQQHSVNSRISTEMVLSPYNPTLDNNTPPYASGSCHYSVPMPLSDGVYNFTVAVYPGGTVMSTESITIESPVESPTITCKRSFLRYFLENDNLECNCSCSDLGTPNGRLVGYYGGVPLNTSNFGYGNLFIGKKHLSRSENGVTIKCVLDWAKNDSDDKSTNITLQIVHLPRILGFQVNGLTIKTKTVSENDSVTLWCQSDGRPSPGMHIIKRADVDQTLISIPPGQFHVSEEKVEVNYVISEMQCEQSGDYRCEVDNDVGQSSQSISLFVTCGPKTAVNRQLETAIELPFLYINDEKRELSFQLTAYPSPLIVNTSYIGHTQAGDTSDWLTNDLIKGDCRASYVSPASVTCTVTVSNVTSSHKGLYKVVFDNGLGEFLFIFELRERNADPEVSSITGPAIGGAIAAVVAVVVIIVCVVLWRKKKAEVSNRNDVIQRQAENLKDNVVEAQAYDNLQMEEVGERSTYETFDDKEKVAVQKTLPETAHYSNIECLKDYSNKITAVEGAEIYENFRTCISSASELLGRSSLALKKARK